MVWLNRPDQRNALSAELVEALLAEFEDASASEDTGAVVLAGRGPAFCAGGDLKGSMGMSGGFVAAHEGREQFAAVMRAIPTAAVPVIAAVHGDAMGGGLGLAAACDILVAEEGAKLGTPEIRLGLFPWIILAVLQRDVPRKKLAELVYTGGRWTAAEAEAVGLVNHVVPVGAGLDKAMEIAEVVASRSPVIVKMGKAAFHRISDLDYDQALAFMHGQLSLNLLTEDAMEGIGAFLQKRAPEWKGR
ncbi:MAG: enoyl-CoA hydratase-related protein [Myxococcota bacterium]